MAWLLLADLNDAFRFERSIAGAALGIKKLQEFLQNIGIRGVAQKGTFSLHADQIFGFELIE
ncbi:MAG: hypothetical protein WCF22_05850, partial [Candidatus Sulfotelmatobacter sp.]